MVRTITYNPFATHDPRAQARYRVRCWRDLATTAPAPARDSVVPYGAIVVATALAFGLAFFFA